MASELEYAELSNRVYGRTAANRSPVPDGWDELTWLPDSASTGFSAGVYRKGSEIVISFTGTNEGKAVDFLEANTPLGLGATSPQVFQAVRLYLETKMQYPNAVISFTGHSLGAGLASMMAVFFDKGATIFDAAPFELGAKSLVGIAVAVEAMLSMGSADSDLLSYAASLGVLFPQREGRVNAVSLEGEVLAGLRTQATTIYGGVEKVVPIGAQSILGSGGVAFGARVELHSMSLLVAMLRSNAFAEAVRHNSDALELFFDSRLYKRNPETSDQANFVDRLLLADMGNPASGTPGRPLLDLFAADLARIEEGSGMSTQPSLRRALTVAAMEYYYFSDTQLASQLFAQTDGGIHFKFGDIGVEQFGLKSPLLLAEAMKGYLLDDEWNLVGRRLEGQDSWHVQSGEGGMTWSAAGATTFDAVIGGASVDVIDAGAGDDILIGGAGQDFLNGGADNDTLIGGVGVDMLEGGDGNDFLLGGLDPDIYVFNGNFGSDIIQDSDGKGLIRIDDVPVDGGGALKVNNNTWQTTDRSLRYVIAQVSDTRSDLVITNLVSGNQITIQNWNDSSHSFGIQLSDVPYQTQSETTFSGDYVKKQTLVIPTAGPDDPPPPPPYWVYSFGANGMYVSDGGAPGAADILFGSHGAPVDESFYGYGGNDGIEANSGDDFIDGGAGDDLLLGGFGYDTIQGGDGNDFIFGSALGRFDLPQRVDFPQPQSSGVELARGFSWVAFDPPGTDASGRDTFEFAGVGIQGWNSNGNVLEFESTGNVIDGGSGNDYIAAGSAADFVNGGDGNDTIDGMAFGDVLFGDAGDDFIAGDGVQGVYLTYTPLEWHGNDILVGGVGNDFLLGQGGNDELYGGVGNDSLFGDDFNQTDTPDSIHGGDYLDGGDGDDEASGGGNNDTIFGGTGGDKLWGDGPDSVVGDSVQGADYLDGEEGNDELTGGGGDDVLIGGAGADTMLGDDVQSKVSVSVHGDDYLEGGDGNDLMAGGGGDDEMYGDAGDDQLEGDDLASNVDPSAHGNDLLNGGEGNDGLFGGGGDDTILGGAGVDTLYGDDLLADLPIAFHGADRLEGGVGDDNLYGGGGDDTLLGGTGTDYLNGGSGDDIFLFDSGDSPLSEGGLTEVVVDDGGVNTAVFGAGIAAGSVGLAVDGSGQYLLIQYGANDRIGVQGGLGGGVAKFSFADVGELSWSELIGQYSDTALVGTSGIGTAQVMGGRNADNLAALGGFAVLSGGRGNDTFIASGGGNVYRYSVGDGTDTVSDVGGTNPGTGSPLPASAIVFGSGIQSSDIQLGYDGTLVLSIRPGSDDKIRITGFDSANALIAPSIDRFVFADGSTLTHAELLARGFDIVGTASDDSLTGTSIDDRFNGGAGNDMQQGGAGADSYAWGLGAGQDTINDGDASASGAVDSLHVGAGLAAQDLVLNRIGNDLLVRVRNGTDSVAVAGHFAGAGLESLVFDDGTEWSAAAIAAHVTNELTTGADNFTGTSADDFIDGLAGNDTIRGGAGNDVIDGNLGNDSLFGDSGDDQLIGGAGTDVLVGGTGGDIYAFGAGGGIDTIDDQGTDGAIDVLRLAAGIGPSDVKLSVGGASISLTIQSTGDKVSFAGPDEIASKKIERIEFTDGTVCAEAQWAQRALQDGATSGNDVIVGFAATNDSIAGLDGNDSLTGNAGNDSLDGGSGNDTLVGSSGADLLVGGDGVDALVGDDGNDTLDGGAGADYMAGGNGDDRLIDGENANGNGGNDTYVFTAWQAATVTEDDLSGIGADTLILPVASTSIVVQRGFNSSSGGWDDLDLQVAGQTGDILLPRFFNSQDNSFKVESIQFTDGVVWQPSDVIARDLRSQTTESDDFNVIGFRWGDVLNGKGGNDGINGLQGDDLIDGGAGADTLTGGIGNDQLLGGAGNDSLMGDNSQSLQSGDGNDTLSGGAGVDTLYGAGGNDTYLFGRGSDVDKVIEAGGVDRILFGTGVLPGDVTLFRNGGDLVAAIDAGPTQLTVTGHFNASSNQVESVEFADGTVWNAAAIVSHTVSGTPNAMTGTAGNDTFVVDNTGDTITEAVNQGTDSVQSSVSYSLGANLENISLTGYLNVTAFGNDLNNQISGNIGHNELSGGAGFDTIIGDSGDDTLIGNSISSPNDGVADSMAGGVGNDTYYVYLSDADQVVEQAGEGIDTINLYVNGPQYTMAANVENLVVTTDIWNSPLTLTGNALNNSITAYPNIDGRTLDGGAGADTLIGAAFDARMTFVVDNPGDVIVSLGSTVVSNGKMGGVDSVISSVDWTLAPNLEHLQLLPGAASHGVGNALNNNLVANSTGDLLEGLGGNDSLLGGGGLDTLVGGQGDDRYTIDWSGANHDVVIELAGEGNDTVSIAGLVRTYSIDEFANIENLTLRDTSGNSNLVGDSASNRLTGNTSSNSVSGGAGDDVLSDGDTSFSGGYDTLSGGDGNDTLSALTGFDWLDGGAGDDLLSLDSANSAATIVFGDASGHDLLYATGANSNRRVLMDAGVQPGDVTFLRSGADLTVAVGSGGSTLTLAGFFVDSVSSQVSGNIAFIEFTDGGTLSAANMAARVAAGNVNNPSASDDALLGGSSNDTLLGLGGNDQILSGSGDDDLAGGTGNDSLYGGTGNDVYRFDAGDGMDTLLDSGGSADRVRFGTGITPNNVTLSRSGDDLLLAVAPSGDLVFVRSFYATAANEIEAVEFADGTVWDNATIKDLAGKIMGTSGADTLTGSTAADRIYGMAGNDSLSGFDGDDLLDGGTGNDTLVGGVGNDTFVVDSTSDVVTEAAGQGTDTVQASVSITLASNVENLVLTGTSAINGTGNSSANTITGNVAANTLSGGTGADTLIGGAGNDIYVIDNIGDVVTELAGEGTDLVQTGVNYTLAANVENLTLTGSSGLTATGNELDNVLTGNSGANSLTGGAGNDRLDGGTGNDAMAGGTGNDTYVVNVSTDVVTEQTNEGIDTIESSVTLTLTSNNVENLTLTGSSPINATGNALDNVLTGNSGTDTLTGMAGNDTYVVGTGDIVTEAAGGGTDTVMAGITWTLASTANVENLTLTGTGAINGTGNTLANALTGNSGNNALDGGTGADTLIGGAGNDTYVVDNTGDVVTELAGEGTDLVQAGVNYTLAANVENLTLTGSSGLTATGNELDNVLTGNSGANSLTGGAGNDRLDGATGNDTMVGGTGNDTYVVNVSTDVVTEQASEGTDTIESSVTLTLTSNNVENLTLTGSGAINATGNALDNVLTGNSGTNTLTGLAGNDTYVVGTGDIVTEAAGGGTDTVMAGITWTLASTANVENLTLTGTGAINGTGNTLDNLLIGNSGANTLSGVEGNDTYDGGAGNDALTDSSTTSNDIYRWGIGSGTDTVSDSGGSDRVDVGAGITAGQLVFMHVGNNLEVTASGISDKLIVSGWYTSTANRVEEFRLADGSSVFASQAPLSVLAPADQLSASVAPGINSERQTIQPLGAKAAPLNGQVEVPIGPYRWPLGMKAWVMDPLLVRERLDPRPLVQQDSAQGGFVRQVQTLITAMASFNANQAGSDAQRQTIQPVHRPDPMWVTPALM